MNVSYEQIVVLHDKLKNHEITWTSAAKSLNISIYQLKTMFRSCQLDELQMNPGRPQNIIPEQTKQEIMKYRDNFRVGYKRCSDAVNRHGSNISENQVRNIFRAEKLFLREAPKEKEKHDRTFYAKYKDQQWNTDLHELKFVINQQNYKQYLMAFIDDATRYIIYAELIPYKTSSNASKVLLNALNTGLTPYCIHADNGGEFTGNEFQETMKNCGIIWSHSKPYTPQENGKIERWWQTLDRSMIGTDNNCIQKVVYEYNNYWSHAALTKRFGQKTTPAEARNYIESWQGKTDLVYIYT